MHQAVEKGSLLGLQVPHTELQTWLPSTGCQGEGSDTAANGDLKKGENPLIFENNLVYFQLIEVFPLMQQV